MKGSRSTPRDVAARSESNQDIGLVFSSKDLSEGKSKEPQGMNVLAVELCEITAHPFFWWGFIPIHLPLARLISHLPSGLGGYLIFVTAAFPYLFRLVSTVFEIPFHPPTVAPKRKRRDVHSSVDRLFVGLRDGSGMAGEGKGGYCRPISLSPRF